MKSIKKVTMYVLVNENELSDTNKEELAERTADGERKSDVLDSLVEQEIDLDLDSFFCDAERWQNVAWRVDNMTEKDYEDDTFKELREQIMEAEK